MVWSYYSYVPLPLKKDKKNYDHLKEINMTSKCSLLEATKKTCFKSEKPGLVFECMPVCFLNKCTTLNLKIQHIQTWIRSRALTIFTFKFNRDEGE